MNSTSRRTTTGCARCSTPTKMSRRRPTTRSATRSSPRSRGVSNSGNGLDHRVPVLRRPLGPPLQLGFQRRRQRRRLHRQRSPLHADRPRRPQGRLADTAERDAFFAFAKSSGLSRYRGSAVPRNSVRSSWTDTIDLRITQTVPVSSGTWRQRCTSASSTWEPAQRRMGPLHRGALNRLTVAATTFDPVGNGGLGQYRYLFNSSTLGSIQSQGDSIVARWQLALGLRVKF